MEGALIGTELQSNLYGNEVHCANASTNKDHVVQSTSLPESFQIETLGKVFN